MAGVEILAINEVAIVFGFSWPVWILLTAFGISFGMIIATIALYDYCKFWSILIGAGIGLVVAGLLGLVPASKAQPIEYETQYKVIISDEVSMNEFLERYEIIEQEGKIYTVRERNGDAE